MIQSSLPTATGCSSVASDEGHNSDLYWVHPDGTGLYQLTHRPDDVITRARASLRSSMMKRGAILWRHAAPPMGLRATRTCFVCTSTSECSVQETVNLTKSKTLDDAPSWGTYPPSARQ